MHTDPHPGGMHWAAAAPRSHWCPAKWTTRPATRASAAAIQSGKAVVVWAALTLMCWSRETWWGCCKSACQPYNAGPLGSLLRVLMEKHSAQDRLTAKKRTREQEWEQTWTRKCGHDCKKNPRETSKKLTCHMEQDDAWILSYFVSSRASVQGVWIGFLDLQRTHDFLWKWI